MTARHPDKEAVRAANPILAVAQRYGLELKRRGRAWMAACPFPAHQHTGQGTPSLALYPDSERFHCFGACGYERPGGDVFDFVCRLREVDFTAALQELAEGGGVAVTALPRPPRREPPLWEPDADERAALEAAVEHYHRRLLRSDRVMRYLAGRGLGPEVVRRFRLGLAVSGQSNGFGGPDGGLLPALRARGLAEAAGRLGLVNNRGREFLRWRVVFPDDAECPTWLIGRKLPWLKRMRLKYLGLPTRGAVRPLLFRRAALALSRRQREPWLVLVEGPADALTLLRWGIPAVALCGTHNGALRRELPADLRLFAALDNDAAGQIGQARLAAMNAVPVALPPGVGDVNELATVPGGSEAFLAALDEAWASVR